ncbi:hypothetical protein TIFTF001_026930 [Ficus carica]|uniref:Uncharacterized protein n=1 Tax=Ficus carica TaxID=3494 RepID=A0AA88IZH4_FICCA|nr:hypothetical protein TIFTF001_026930 [Ficus carica]
MSLTRLCPSAFHECRLQYDLHRKKSRSVPFPTVRCSTGHSLPSSGPDISSLAFPHHQEHVGNPTKPVANIITDGRGFRMGEGFLKKLWRKAWQRREAWQRRAIRVERGKLVRGSGGRRGSERKMEASAVGGRTGGGGRTGDGERRGGGGRERLAEGDKE